MMDTSQRVPARVLAGAVALACLAHAIIWSLAPLLFLGNLHTDTVEATSWATHWDWGYFKHPPLVVWLFKLVVGLPGSRMLKFLLLAQATVLASAALIWLTVRIYASQWAAAFGVLVYVASPPATFFATQVNHNSLSIPFGAAILFLGLRYFEKRRTADILALGVIAGLALLTKYQTAFFLMTLAVLALVVARFRWVWTDPRGYVGAALALAVFAPHLWWDYQHGWRTLLYASADRPLRTIGDFGYSLNELLDGVLMCLVGPLLAWLVVGRPRPALVSDAVSRLGWLLIATPIAIMVALGFASGQILRQGWLIPLMPGVAVGVALVFARAAEGITVSPRAIAARAAGVSGALAVAFALFLLGRAAMGHPVAAYSLDGRDFTGQVQSLWRARSGGAPIPCLLTPNRSFALATMLYLDPIPSGGDLDPLPDAAAAMAACRGGGLVLSPEGFALNEKLDASTLDRATVSVRPWPAIGAGSWTFRLYFLPAAP